MMISRYWVIPRQELLVQPTFKLCPGLYNFRIDALQAFDEAAGSENKKL